jgi:hypothetical protein
VVSSRIGQATTDVRRGVAENEREQIDQVVGQDLPIGAPK